MELDDRDPKFEKALARHLRDAAQRAACPDAEILAAYHERTLSPEELNSWKKHIASCAACQEVLAQLEATDAIPVEVDHLEKVVTMQLSEPEEFLGEMPMESARKVMAAATAAVRSIEEVQAAPPMAKLRLKTNWRWLAPAGAVAAGLLVWVAVHERPSPKLEKTTSVQVAENRREVTPPAPPQAESKASTRNDLQARAETQPAELASKEQKIPVDLLQQEKKTAPLPRKAAALPRMAAPIKKDREAAARDAATGVALEKELSAANQLYPAPGVVQEQKEVETAPMAGPPAPQAALAGKSAPAPAAAAPHEVAKQKAAAQTAVMTETVEVTSNFKDANALRMDAARNPRLIAVPNGKAAWRVGPVGLVERTTNGGKSWTPQASGVVADLAAGSAPSKKVCWIVGRAGTILLTLDGGVTWKQLTSPITDDLGGIRATDALHATIWDVPNRQSYETRDAGATWTRVANE